MQEEKRSLASNGVVSYSGRMPQIITAIILIGCLALVAWALDEAVVKIIVVAGLAVCLALVFRDITQRKKGEDERARLMLEIEAHRQRLNNIIASVPGVVWEAWGQPDEAAQRIDFVSNYVETMLGYSVEEWLSTPNFWLTIVHPEDRDRAGREGTAIFLSRKPGISRFRWVAKDGRVLWVEAQSAVVCDEHGNPLGMRGVTMDISERMYALQAVKESEERYHDLFENANDIVYTLNLEGNLTDLNKRGEQISGYSRTEMLGKPIAQLISPDYVDKMVAMLQRKLDGEPITNYELEITAKDGRKIMLEVGSRLIYKGNAPVGIQGIARDVTERKQIEQEREQLLSHAQAARLEAEQATKLSTELLAREQAARIEAEAANRMKDEFLATVSHELRTPLNAILGWAHILRKGQIDEPTLSHALETIERNAKVQAQLINDILDVSRIITGNLRLEVQRVDLASVIEAAIDVIRPAADAKNIFIDKALDSGVKFSLGDPNRLQQIIWNLLSNAVKFTPRGGIVRVELAQIEEASRGPHVEIKVSDTGQGIDPDFLPYVFERFRQADSTTTRKHGGLGLGLAIVRHLVEMHGGTVQADSEGEAKGATFTVRLPQQAAGLTDNVRGGNREARFEESLLAGAAELEGQSAGAGEKIASDARATFLDDLRILVVDDSPDTLELLALSLGGRGAEVKIAESAREAVEILQQWRADVLVADIAMPDENGYELIRRVRSLDTQRVASIPAIALSAHARNEDREDALRAGYQTHIAKPVDPGDLASIIASLVKHAKWA